MFPATQRFIMIIFDWIRFIIATVFLRQQEIVAQPEVTPINQDYEEKIKSLHDENKVLQNALDQEKQVGKDKLEKLEQENHTLKQTIRNMEENRNIDNSNEICINSIQENACEIQNSWKCDTHLDLPKLTAHPEFSILFLIFSVSKSFQVKLKDCCAQNIKSIFDKTFTEINKCTKDEEKLIKKWTKTKNISDIYKNIITELNENSTQNQFNISFSFQLSFTSQFTCKCGTLVNDLTRPQFILEIGHFSNTSSTLENVLNDFFNESQSKNCPTCKETVNGLQKLINPPNLFVISSKPRKILQSNITLKKECLQSSSTDYQYYLIGAINETKNEPIKTFFRMKYENSDWLRIENESLGKINEKHVLESETNMLFFERK